MKKIIVLALLMAIISNGLLAKTNRRISNPIVKNYEYYKGVSYLFLSDEKIVEKWYLERIPKEYGDAFLYYTKDKPEMRMYFYSLMVHESDNFRAYKHKNKDGSYDYGPSQLNSRNIKNPLFKKLYNPKDESHITSVYCFYMVMSINFYWDLVCKHGYDYAFYAYNGGEKTVGYKKNGLNKNTSLMRNVTAYDKKVRGLMENHIAELNAYMVVAREMHINELMNSQYLTDAVKHNNTDHNGPVLYARRTRVRKNRQKLNEVG